MKELIKLDALVAMRDMDVHARSLPRGQHPVGRKMYFDPLFRENASKNMAFFFKCLILLDVITQNQQ